MPVNNELKAERILNAPRALVWEAWSKPEHLAIWWGPRGFTSTIETFEFKPGGVWKFVMHGSDGKDYKNESAFREIKKPDLIVYEHVSWPKQTVTVRFEEQGADKTKVTFSQVFERAEDFEKLKPVATKGNQENFDRVQEYVDELARTRKGEKDLTIERIFNATPEEVFACWTQEEHLNKWWGPKDFGGECKIDFRVGGRYVYAMITPDGKKYYNSGFFREIEAPRRIVSTMYFSDEKGQYVGAEAYGMTGFLGEMLDVITFEPHGVGQTKLTLRRNHPLALAKRFQEDLGWGQSLDKLANELKTITDRG